LESDRKHGGVRGEFVEDRIGYLALCNGEGLPDDFVVDFLNIDADGKSRSVTKASCSQSSLSPLHRLLYDRLSGEDWLLRGDARERKFGRFEPRAGHVFVSGDYESATDNLPIEVAETILRTLRDTSHHIPDGIWQYALKSNRALIRYPDGVTARQERGQLMGNYLSFPLLCLQNFAAFSYLVRDPSVPVKINGDDIVFRADRRTANSWMEGVGRLGLTLSRGKTLVKKSVFSLNSTFFRSTRSGVRQIPVARPACLSRAPAADSIIPALVSFSRGFRGVTKERVQALYLRWRRTQICALGRAVRRDLGGRVGVGALEKAGLLGFEGEMLLASPVPNPLPFERPPIRGLGVPEGWQKVPVPRGTSRSVTSAWEDEMREQMTTAAWVTRPASEQEEEKEKWDRAVQTGHSSWLRERRLWRVLGRQKGSNNPYVEFARRVRSAAHVAVSWSPSSMKGRKERAFWVPSWALERSRCLGAVPGPVLFVGSVRS